MTQDKVAQIKATIVDGKLVQAAGGITSTIAQSDKLGFDWKNIYVNDVLVRQEYIEQEVKRGTVENPIEWTAGIALIPNAYYTHGGETKVWMGAAGTAADWTNSGFVPI